jgi:hypothetical protein
MRGRMRSIEAIGQLSFVCGEDGEGRSGMMKCEALLAFAWSCFSKLGRRPTFKAAPNWYA